VKLNKILECQNQLWCRRSSHFNRDYFDSESELVPTI